MPNVKTLATLVALAGASICGAIPAYACKIVGYKNGEPLCITTSDGPGQPYVRDVSPLKTYRVDLKQRPTAIGSRLERRAIAAFRKSR